MEREGGEERREGGEKEKEATGDEQSLLQLTICSLVFPVLVDVLKVLQGLDGEEVLFTLLAHTL